MHKQWARCTLLPPVTPEPYHERGLIIRNVISFFFWENVFWKVVYGLTGNHGVCHLNLLRAIIFVCPLEAPLSSQSEGLQPFFELIKLLPLPFLMRRCALPSAKPTLPMWLPNYLPVASHTSLYTIPCASSPFWACLHSYFGPGLRSGMSLGMLTVTTDYRRKCLGSFSGSRKALTPR